VARRLARQAPASPAAAIAPPHDFILPPLFPYQVRLVTSRAWEQVIVSATQIGKTFACACWLLAVAWEHPGTLSWWCGPTKRQARNGYRAMKRIALSAGILLPGQSGYADGEMVLRLINGATIECQSWKNPANLQGPSVYAVVIDEAGLLTSEARAVISSRRSAFLGPARYIGNPAASGSEFWLLHQQATEAVTAEDPYWGVETWTWETRAACLAPLARERYEQFIRNEERTLAPFEFARLYGAQWAVPERAIFGAVLDRLAVLDPDHNPHPGHPYLVAWDIGISSDYTVGAPLCLECFTVTDIHRERPGTSDGLEQRIVDYTRHWNNGTAVIEKNGMGLIVFDRVDAIYKDVQGWTTDNTNKRASVFEVLRRADTGGLTIARLPAMLNELRVFESQQNPKTQTWSFAAPKGAKDDAVMALLIAVGAATSGAAAHIEMLRRKVAERDKKKREGAKT